MSGLLRAEWLRLRKRRDLWIVALAVVALSIPTYFSGLANTGHIPIPPGDIPPDVLAEIRQRQQLRLIYAFPQSIGTVVQNGQILALALIAYLAAAVTGADFAYGTIRTSLVAHADRAGFVLVRLVGIAVAAVLLIVLMVALGVVLPAVAVLAGTDLPTVAEPDIGRLLGVVGASLLASLFLIGLTTLFALVIRNAAIALVLTIAYAFVEGAVVGLIVQRVGEGSPIRWVPPVANLQLLFQRAEDPTVGASMPALVAIFIGVGWAVLAWAACAWILARSDVRE